MENTYQIQISLKAFEYFFIEKAHKEINQMILLFDKNLNLSIRNKARKLLIQNGDAIENTQFNDIKFNKCTFPLKILRYTVIRSPHIDKKARDQFEIRQHKITLKHRGHWSSENVRIFLQNLKHKSFNGVQMQLKIISTSYGPTKNKNLVS